MTGIFANAQALLIDFLRAGLMLRTDEVLRGVVVGQKVPATRESGGPPLIVVRRSGGPADLPVLDLPRLDFMHWHTSEFKAQAVASITRKMVLFDLRGRVLGGHTIYRVREFSGPTQYQDPAGSNIPIVIFTAEISIRVI